MANLQEHCDNCASLKSENERLLDVITSISIDFRKTVEEALTKQANAFMDKSQWKQEKENAKLLASLKAHIDMVSEYKRMNNELKARVEELEVSLVTVRTGIATTKDPIPKEEADLLYEHINYVLDKAKHDTK